MRTLGVPRLVPLRATSYQSLFSCCNIMAGLGCPLPLCWQEFNLYCPALGRPRDIDLLRRFSVSDAFKKKLPKHWWPANIAQHGNGNSSLAEKLLERARTMARLRVGGLVNRLFARRLLPSVSHADIHALHFPARVAGAVCIRGGGPMERRWKAFGARFRLAWSPDCS